MPKKFESEEEKREYNRKAKAKQRQREKEEEEEKQELADKQQAASLGISVEELRKQRQEQKEAEAKRRKEESKAKALKKRDQKRMEAKLEKCMARMNPNTGPSTGDAGQPPAPGAGARLSNTGPSTGDAGQPPAPGAGARLSNTGSNNGNAGQPRAPGVGAPLSLANGQDNNNNMPLQQVLALLQRQHTAGEAPPAAAPVVHLVNVTEGATYSYVNSMHQSNVQHNNESGGNGNSDDLSAQLKQMTQTLLESQRASTRELSEQINSVPQSVAQQQMDAAEAHRRRKTAVEGTEVPGMQPVSLFPPRSPSGPTANPKEEEENEFGTPKEQASPDNPKEHASPEGIVVTTVTSPEAPTPTATSPVLTNDSDPDNPKEHASPEGIVVTTVTSPESPVTTATSPVILDNPKEQASPEGIVPTTVTSPESPVTTATSTILTSDAAPETTACMDANAPEVSSSHEEPDVDMDADAPDSNNLVNADDDAVDSNAVLDSETTATSRRSRFALWDYFFSPGRVESEPAQAGDEPEPKHEMQMDPPRLAAEGSKDGEELSTSPRLSTEISDMTGPEVGSDFPKKDASMADSEVGAENQGEVGSDEKSTSDAQEEVPVPSIDAAEESEEDEASEDVKEVEPAPDAEEDSKADAQISAEEESEASQAPAEDLVEYQGITALVGDVIQVKDTYQHKPKYQGLRGKLARKVNGNTFMVDFDDGTPSLNMKTTSLLKVVQHFGSTSM